MKAETSGSGTMTDPSDYLEWLEGHADELPPGARAFATHPEHYDFSHPWCPRSASFDRMSTRHMDDGVAATLVLAAWGGAPPEFVVRYKDVTRVDVEGNHGGLPRSSLLVDEILPHDDGVSHELFFRHGTITVIAKDFTAGWSGKAGPDSPRDPLDSWHLENPATHVRLMRTRPGAYFLDDRFATVATAVGWHSRLWADDHARRAFQDWASTRLIGGAGPTMWEALGHAGGRPGHRPPGLDRSASRLSDRVDLRPARGVFRRAGQHRRMTWVADRE